ncbi:MAG: hypothetical protein HY953_04450 [Candidatus Rokubacteria bacterium]|nr:hypothetical protein [Candidatus Rokubacteria bacterium]
MKIICSGCRTEGRPALLGEREPLDDPTETHGVCRRHKLELLARLPSHSFPGVQLLLVIAQKDLKLYQYLERRLADVSGVKVIAERRRGDRRRTRREVVKDRRHIDRRLRPGEPHAMGYTVVRFGKRSA